MQRHHFDAIMDAIERNGDTHFIARVSLRNSEVYRGVIDNLASAPDVIMVTDPSGMITFVALTAIATISKASS